MVGRVKQNTPKVRDVLILKEVLGEFVYLHIQKSETCILLKAYVLQKNVLKKL